MSKIELKSLFEGQRKPVPKYITELFPDPKCKIENEKEFIKSIQNNLAEYSILRTEVRTYQSNKYMVNNILEYMEGKLKNLRSIQENGYNDLSELKSNEKSIEVMLSILDEFLRKSEQLTEFVFPFMDDILELTACPVLLRNLVLTALTIVFSSDYDNRNLSCLVSLFAYLTPFIKALHYFEWDYKNMVTKIEEIMEEKKNNSTQVGPVLKSFLSIVLEHSEKIIEYSESDSSLKSSQNATVFIFKLVKKFVDAGIVDKKDREKYYKLIGEIVYYTYMFDPKINENIIPEIGLIHCFIGLYLDSMREDDVPADVLALNLEECHFQFKHVLKPSIVDITMSKLEVVEKTDPNDREKYAGALEVLNLYLVAINHNIELYKASEVIQDSRSDFELLIKRMFTSYNENDKPLPPPIRILWDKVFEIYKRYYNKLEDEEDNTFAKLDDSPKGKINILFYNVFVLVNSALSQMTDTEENEEGESDTIIKEEYALSISYIMEEMLKNLETYSLQENYISALVLVALVATIKDISSMRLCRDLHVPIRVMKKIESFVEWTMSKPFDIYMIESQIKAKALKIIKIFIELATGVYVNYDEETLDVKAKQEYLNHMSTFTMIDAIQNKPDEEFFCEEAIKARELMIRYYIFLHLHSQCFAYRDEDDAQIVYYNVERLLEVWRLIRKYSKYEKYVVDEFIYTNDISKNMDEDYTEAFLRDVGYEMLSTLLPYNIFNLDTPFENEEQIEEIRELLFSMLERQLDNSEVFLSELAIVLQEMFEKMLAQLNKLDQAYKNNQEDFNRIYLITEEMMPDFMTRLMILMSSMGKYDSNILSSNLFLQEVIKSYLPRIITSPGFYLLGNDHANSFCSTLPKLTVAHAILPGFLEEYIKNLKKTAEEFLSLFETHYNDENSLFLKKVQNIFAHANIGGLSNSGYYLNQFFDESYLHDPREIYKVNSLTFMPFFLNCWDLKNWSSIVPVETVDKYARMMLDIYEEYYPLLIKIQALQLKKNIQRGVSYNRDLLFYFGFEVSLIKDMKESLSQLFQRIFNFIIENYLVKGACENDPEKYLEQGSAGLYLVVLLENASSAHKTIFKILDSNENLEKIMTFVNQYLFGLQELLYEKKIIKNLSEWTLKSDYNISYLAKPESLTVLAELVFGLYRRFYEKLESLYPTGEDSDSLNMWEAFILKVASTIAPQIEMITYDILSFELLENGDFSPKKALMSILSCFMHLLEILIAKPKRDQNIFEMFGFTKPKKEKRHPAKKTGRLHGKKMRVHGHATGKHRRDDNDEEEIHEVKEAVESAAETNVKNVLTESLKDLLPKIIILSNSRLRFHVPEKYYPVFEETWATFQGFASELRPSNKELSPEISELVLNFYSDQILNNIRNLVPVLSFVYRYANGRKDNTIVTAEFINKLVEALNENLLVLSLSNTSSEKKEFIINDFMEMMNKSVNTLADILQHMITYHALTKIKSNKFDKILETFLLAFNRYSQFFFEFSPESTPVLDVNIHTVLYSCSLLDPKYIKLLLENKEMWKLISRSSDIIQYNLYELIIQQSIGIENLLQARLKALVALDDSGARIIQNYSIKYLEFFWENEMKEIFNSTFSIEPREGKPHKHASNKIVFKNANDSPTLVNLDGGKQVSTLGLLQHGISQPAKYILGLLIEDVMRSLVEIPNKKSNEFFKCVDAVVNKAELECLEELMRRYPEISLYVLNYKVGNKFEMPSKPGILPKWRGDETFLQVYVKYILYFAHLREGDFLASWIINTQNPLFIEVNGEKILLASYLEYLVLNEMHNVLEETLEDKDFLEQAYAQVMWITLPTIVIYFLNSLGEIRQRNYKQELTNKFVNLCFKALEHFHENNPRSAHLKDKNNQIYIFLNKLTSAQVFHKTKEFFRKEKKVPKALFKQKGLIWSASILKEKFGFGQKNYQSISKLEINEQQLINDLKVIEQNRNNFDHKSIEENRVFAILQGIIHGGVPTHLIRQDVDAHSYFESYQEIFDNYIDKLKSEHKSKDNKLAFEYLNTIKNIRISSIRSSQDFSIESLDFIRVPSLLIPAGHSLPEFTATEIKPKFRLEVKKGVRWSFEREISELEEEIKVDNNGEGHKEKERFTKKELKQLEESIKKNRDRIKEMIRVQHESDLLNKLHKLVEQGAEISQMLHIETENNNIEFFEKLSPEDKKLVLALASEDFINSLKEEQKKEAGELKEALLKREKKGKEEDELSHEGGDDVEEYSSSESDEEEYVDEDEENEVEEECSDVPGDPNPNSKKNEQEEDDGEWEDEDEDGDGQDDNDEDYEDVDEDESEEDKNKGVISPPELVPMDYVPPKNDNTHEEEKKEEVKNTESGSEDDGGYHEAHRRFEEEQKQHERPKKKKKPKKDDEWEDEPEETISSDCHTHELSVSSYVDSLHPEDVVSEDDFDEDMSSEDENADIDDADQPQYDEMYEINDENDEEEEWTNWETHFRQAKSYIKTIEDLQTPTFKQFEEIRNPEDEKEFVIKIFNLFIYNKKRDALDWDDEIEHMNSYSLFYRYLILALLDPRREKVLLSVLVLNLLGYTPKGTKEISNPHLIKDKIINFLHQYAIKNPYIFFTTLELKDYLPLLDTTNKIAEAPEQFNLLELLISFYLVDFTTENSKRVILVLLQRLISFLLKLRYASKPDDTPQFFKELREKSVQVLDDKIVDKLVSITANPEIINTKSRLRYYCLWLVYLAYDSRYIKKLINAAENLLKSQIPVENNKLKEFISYSKNVLSKQTIQDEDHYFFINFFSNVYWNVPDIVGIIRSAVINSPDFSEEMQAYITENPIFSQDLTNVSLVYMEALEIITKLREKNILTQVGRMKEKFKKMLEVPVQLYSILIKLKELKTKIKSLDKIFGELEIPALTKRFSSDIQSAPPLKLEKSYSELGKAENLNFVDTMTQWVGKCRSLINETFRVSSSDIHQEESNMSLVKKFPWLIDLKTKEKILREVFQKKVDDYEEETTFYIRRNHILEDTIKEFDKYSSEEKKFFKIEFVKEPGVDQGGLKKEWLNLLSKDIFGPNAGLFKLSPNGRSIHPNPLSLIQPGALRFFKLAGNLAAIAIKEKIPIDVNFSKSFLKLIMNVQPVLNDLEDIDPELMSSLKWMLHNDVSVLEQPFMYELELIGLRVSQELRKGGFDVIVDETNKTEYIEKLLLVKTYKEVSQQIEKFKEGFYEIIPQDIMEMFSPGELEILISGQSEIDVEDLKNHAKYSNLHKDDPIVKWFWEIVENMDQITLANLLFFITGSSKVPHGGFKELPITLKKGSTDISTLPIAHTCFQELEIPVYYSKEQLHEKLFLAIIEGREGFHMA